MYYTVGYIAITIVEEVGNYAICLGELRKPVTSSKADKAVPYLTSQLPCLEERMRMNLAASAILAPRLKCFMACNHQVAG